MALCGIEMGLACDDQDMNIAHQLSRLGSTRSEGESTRQEP